MEVRKASLTMMQEQLREKLRAISGPTITCACQHDMGCDFRTMTHEFGVLGLCAH